MQGKRETVSSRSVSRRHFLRGLGAGVLLASAPGGLRVRALHALENVAASRFGRLFPELAPFASATPQMEAALLEIGKPGGILDAHDNLAAGPVALIVDPSLSLNNPNAAVADGPAGTTFMGQFMDHDMTFDTTSRLGVPTKPQGSPNARTPAFDLDSVYGRGPIADSQLYDPADRVKFKIEGGGLFEDLPRAADSTAIIADPRNDENLIIAGLQVAFLLFHNNAVDVVRAAGLTDPDEVFDEARRLLTWHYHWIILHEILPSFIGQHIVDDILTGGRRLYRPGDQVAAFIPVEFQAAAYRFGHSLVRPSYRANLKGDNGSAFFGMIFDPAGQGQADPVDLRGGARAPRRFIGWQTFFDFGDGEVKPRKRIDTRISTPLFHLPLGAIASGTPPTALPQRNLLRHLTWELPSGQAVAERMRAPVLTAGDLAELAGYGLGLESSTPLWYYVLKEAQLAGGGQHLGPVGGRIVGEVIIGLLQVDRDSYLSREPGWRPTLPSVGGAGDFRMVDFLSFAGVDPASRGQ
jgi:hypothetical protein